MLQKRVSISRAGIRRRVIRQVRIPSITQRGRGLRLELFQDAQFQGRQIVFIGGEVAVRSLNAFQFNDLLSSFRVRNSLNSRRLTLLLFEDVNYQGRVLVFRGSQNVGFLNSFNDKASSFVLVARNLSFRQIDRIQRTGIPPSGVLEITD